VADLGALEPGARGRRDGLAGRAAGGAWHLGAAVDHLGAVGAVGVGLADPVRERGRGYRQSDKACE
jgi:hypothetical protein